jgi:hypothetical protein
LNDQGPWSRRDLLHSAAAGLASAFGADALVSAVDPPQPDRIRRENELQGTRDWIATNVRIDPKTRYRSPGIEGYASRTSLRAGETLSIFVSTNPPSPFVLDLYRMGYYQGLGARHLLRLGPFAGAVQPEPPIGPMRLRECAWEPCASLTVPEDWTSGVYLAKLTAEKAGIQSFIIFIVRDDRKTDFLFQVSDNTWNAYNRWPSQFSLYDDGVKEWYWGPDVQTSFDRPYGKYCQLLDAPLSVGSGEFLLWEFPLAFWMEQHGYDVSYISNVDTHADPGGLRRAKGWISVGHDEYWSRAMFRNVQDAIADGLNVAFLSANSICGVTQILPSTDGRPHRVITRVGKFTAPEKWELDAGFPEEARLRDNGPGEGTLIGARSTFPVTGGGDWTCRKPDHWLFAGTRMKAGDGIPGIVGWEFHGDPAPIPGLEIVASGTAKSDRGEGTYTATIYPGPKGNVVFNAATIWWSDGLAAPPGYVRPTVYAKPRGPDPRVQRITANLLERFRAT